MADKDETAAINGEKKSSRRKSPATTRDVSPVRPAAATPDEDSIWAVVGVVPREAPTTVATASAVSAGFAFGIFPPYIKPACSATPIIVPVVSKIVTSKKAKTTPY